MKSARQIAILDLINQYSVETQEDLADLLRENGFQVTQATISRDMKELRLAKVLSSDGHYQYAVSERSDSSASDRLIQMLSDTVISVHSAYNQIVIKTISASASIAAETIDGLQWPEVLGTIAGENTILLIIRAIDEVEAVLQRIKTMIAR